MANVCFLQTGEEVNSGQITATSNVFIDIDSSGSQRKPATARLLAKPMDITTSWPRRLAPYRQPANWRSALELAVTLIPFAGLWVAIAWFSAIYEITFFLTVPAAGFLVRLFMIQHDCGHGSMFSRREVNDWIGRFLGVLTLTPYDHWRRSHAHHHAGSGNLDRRGIGDITTLTVREYAALGTWGRLGYRLYRHPLVMFGLGPIFLFVVQHRFPTCDMNSRSAWISTMATNAGIGLVVGVMVLSLGWRPFLLIQGPITVIAASIGVWLFYVQHQFEETLWARSEKWTPEGAAMQGSSYYVLPQPIAWFTANIGLHHIHHLSSRIPFYRLPDVLRRWPRLGEVKRLTIRESLRCVSLALWDEEAHRLVPFGISK